MSTATPATPAVPASPSAKKAKPGIVAKLRSVGVDFVFGFVALLFAGLALNYTVEVMGDPGFGPAAGGTVGILVMLAGVWLVADQGLIKSKLIRFVIGVALVAAAAGLLVSGVRFGTFNVKIFWSVIGMLVALVVEAALFWCRRWLYRSLKR